MHAQRGLTLLELMVVLAIIGLATAGVALSLRDTSQSRLEQEGQRLQALLESARVQSRSQGIPLIWRPTPEGFVFESPRGFKQPPRQEPWLTSPARVEVQVANVNAAQVPLGPEPVLQPTRITLHVSNSTGRQNVDHALHIVTDGLKPFQVEP